MVSNPWKTLRFQISFYFCRVWDLAIFRIFGKGPSIVTSVLLDLWFPLIARLFYQKVRHSSLFIPLRTQSNIISLTWIYRFCPSLRYIWPLYLKAIAIGLYYLFAWLRGYPSVCWVLRMMEMKLAMGFFSLVFKGCFCLICCIYYISLSISRWVLISCWFHAWGALSHLVGWYTGFICGGNLLFFVGICRLVRVCTHQSFNW